jgi:hypothetical protein
MVGKTLEHTGRSRTLAEEANHGLAALEEDFGCVHCVIWGCDWRVRNRGRGSGGCNSKRSVSMMATVGAREAGRWADIDVGRRCGREEERVMARERGAPHKSLEINVERKRASAHVYLHNPPETAAARFSHAIDDFDPCSNVLCVSCMQFEPVHSLFFCASGLTIPANISARMQLNARRRGARQWQAPELPFLIVPTKAPHPGRTTIATFSTTTAPVYSTLPPIPSGNARTAAVWAGPTLTP